MSLQLPIPKTTEQATIDKYTPEEQLAALDHLYGDEDTSLMSTEYFTANIRAELDIAKKLTDYLVI